MALNRACFMAFFTITLVTVSSAHDYYCSPQGNNPSSVYKSHENYPSPAAKRTEKYGPYGSELPTNYEFQLGEGERFTQVYVKHGHLVDAIGFVVTKSDGSNRRVHIGGEGGVLSTIVLKDGEYLTRISGKYGFDTERKIITIGIITIHTNFKSEGYGPFGKAKGATGVLDFESPQNPGGPIVGVFGRSNMLLESIGIIVLKDSY